MLQVSSCFIYRFKLLLPDYFKREGDGEGAKEEGESWAQLPNNKFCPTECCGSAGAVSRRGGAVAGAGEQEAPREFRNQGGFDLQA